MRKILVRGLLVALSIALQAVPVLCPEANAQTNEWTWVGGSSAGPENQVTGTLGIPAIGNIPAARYQATTWSDKSGNFWLFGGTDQTGFPDVELNDLWEFNPSTSEWGWMAGSSTGGQSGVYGALGTPSAHNVPGGREDASSWTDSKGNLWLFGGYGLDADGTMGVLNDLWEFNPSTGEWTWMSGSSTASNCFNDGSGNAFGAIDCAQPSIYGALGTPAAGNTPGSREAAITWTDNKGNLWLFGGWSYDVSAQVQYYFNELWEYNPSTNQWAWMGGSKTRDGSACLWNVNLWPLTCGEPGVYGTIGTSAAGNIPGGRAGSAKWTDSQGNLWIFSGSGFDVNGYFGDPNDLWEFNASTVQWTWMGGNDVIPPYGCDDYDCSGPAVYGTLGTPAAGNLPQGRDHAVGWNDSAGNLWLFGGGGGEVPDNINNGGLNDLWEFNPSTDEWALMGGSIQAICGWYCSSSPLAVYGSGASAAPGDGPGTRFASAGWTDSRGNFWLFGGHPSSHWVFLNDLWEYQPSTGPLPTTATPTFSVPTGSYASAQSVTISDATNGAFIYYTTDGTTPTVNSANFQTTIWAPLSIPYSETLKAIAVASGCLTSAVATATYTLPPQAATPTFSLPAGTYTSFQTVTISDTTPGATIYYTTNGSLPNLSSGVYSGPISIANAYTPIWAIAAASDYSTSNMAVADYTLNLPDATVPTFSVGFGTYNTPQTVTISDSTPGATIYYQVNTGYPTTSSPVYSGPITVSSTESLWAMATASNYFGSGPVGGTYIINPLAPQTATPTFSVPAGTYSASQTVSISDATSGASIYYSTDGSSPTTSSTFYSGPVTVSSNETLKAIATASGDTASAVASVAYTINLPVLDFSVTATPASITVTAGQSGSTTITVTPLNGFNSTVLFGCSGLLAGTSCSFSPSTVTPSGTVASTALTLTASTSASRQLPAPMGYMPVAALALTLCFVRFRNSRWYSVWILCVAATLSLLCLSACGGGSSNSSRENTPTPTQESGTVTVTATSGSLSHSATLTVSVN